MVKGNVASDVVQLAVCCGKSELVLVSVESSSSSDVVLCVVIIFLERDRIAKADERSCWALLPPFTAFEVMASSEHEE